MFDRLAAHWPPTIRNLSTRTRHSAIGAAAVIPALLIGVLGSTEQLSPQPGEPMPQLGSEATLGTTAGTVTVQKKGTKHFVALGTGTPISDAS